MNFGKKLPKKGIFAWKKTWTSPLTFPFYSVRAIFKCKQFEQVQLTNQLLTAHLWKCIRLLWQLICYASVTNWTKFAQKGYFPWKTKKSEHHHWILHILIRLGAKFQLKLTIFNLWTKFALLRIYLVYTKD